MTAPAVAMMAAATRRLPAWPVFAAADRFAIHVLPAGDRELASRFAKGVRILAEGEFTRVGEGPPGLPEALATAKGILRNRSGHEETLTALDAAESLAGSGLSHEAAITRLDAFESALREPLPVRAPPLETPAPAFASPVDEAGFGGMVARAKDYIAAGDIFQVVLSHRFSAPWSADPFAFYARRILRLAALEGMLRDAVAARIARRCCRS